MFTAAFDATALTYLFVPNAPSGIDRPRDRIDFRISDLHGKGARIIVPTPALCELLVKTGHSSREIINLVSKTSRLTDAPLDVKAAIEAAIITRAAIKAGSKKGNLSGNWPKIKFDRQIVAIAKANDAAEIYSEDPDIKTIATPLGIKVVSVCDLPLPYATYKGPTLFQMGDATDESKKEE